MKKISETIRTVSSKVVCTQRDRRLKKPKTGVADMKIYFCYISDRKGCPCSSSGRLP